MLRSKMFAAGVSLVALLLALGPRATARAEHIPSHASVLQQQVQVSSKGFNGKPGFTIDVEQGQRVELTFVWADTDIPDNAHRIYLRGYELETDVIDSRNREATLSFVADKPGTFNFMCEWACTGHKSIQDGQLKVRTTSAGATAPGASYVATTVTVEPSTWKVTRGPVTLTAILNDSDGKPIARAPVRFFAEGELAGITGVMEVGEARTDKDGVARLDYEPTRRGERRITARFEGMGLYGESEQSIQIQALTSQAAYSVAPTGLDSLRRWAPFGLALVVLGVWSTFAYVVYQVYRIARAGQ